MTATEGGRKILYVDMDNTLVDFPSGIARLSEEDRHNYLGNEDDCPGIFATMDPVEGAIEAFDELARAFDTYILSTAPWNNPSAWSDKLEWVRRHLGADDTSPAYKRLILTHHKNLSLGDYLVDDRDTRGASHFRGEWIHFGTADFPDWKYVTEYLLDRA
jgi:5'-nucleotidase